MKFRLTHDLRVELLVRYTPHLILTVLDRMTLAEYEAAFGFRQASQLVRERDEMNRQATRSACSETTGGARNEQCVRRWESVDDHRRTNLAT